jgi:uncharacterized delta-60 repeat protein
MNPRTLIGLGLAFTLTVVRAQTVAVGRVDPGFVPPTLGDQNAVLSVPGCRVLVAGTTVNQLMPDGSLDGSFRVPDTGGATLFAMARLTRGANAGRILIGGSFTQLANQGGGPAFPRIGLARLEENGNVDASFPAATQVTDGAGVTGVVTCFLELPDGKVLVGGAFSSVGGLTRSGVVRLMPDGTVDPSFAAPRLLTGSDPAVRGSVRGMALQNLLGVDHLVIVGDFTSVGGSPRRAGIARLKLGGSTPGALDPAFDPGLPYTIAFGLAPRSVVVHPDGRILVAGALPVVATPPAPNLRTNIYRLSAAGIPEPTSLFRASAIGDDSIDDLVLQPDGKILIVGEFTSVGSVPRRRLARLQPDGSLDPSFDPGIGADFSVTRMAVQPDQKLLVAGRFRAVNGVGRSGVARVFGDGLDALPCLPGYPLNVFVNGAPGSGSVMVTLPEPSAPVTCTGACSPAATVPHGSRVLCRATPTLAEWRFAGWNINGVTMNVAPANPIELEVIGPTTVVAIFARQRTLSLEVSQPFGAGASVTSSPVPSGSAIDCPAGACSAQFDEPFPGSAIVLNANVPAGFVVSWEDITSGSPVPLGPFVPPNVARIPLPSDKHIRAVFVPEVRRLEVVITPPGGGAVTFGEVGGSRILCPGDCSESFPGNPRVSLEATANAGYRFAGWSGGLGTTDLPGIEGVLSANQIVTARFIQQRKLSVVIVNRGGLPGEGGRVVSAAAPAGSPVPGIDCPGICDAWFDQGSGFSPNFVRLTATPPPGWTVSWSGGLGTGDANQVDIFVGGEDLVITATFTAPSAPPVVDVAPSAAAFCAGDAGVLLGVRAHAAVAGVPLTYRWRRNGIDVGVEGTAQDYLATQPGSYDVVVGTAGGPTVTVPVPAAVVTENAPPVARPDTLNAAALGITTVYPEASLLGNDSDPEGRPLTLVSVDAVSASGGSLTRTREGTILYLPATSSPTDGFRYRVSDGTCIREGEVTLTAGVPLSLICEPNEVACLRVGSPPAGWCFVEFNAPFAGTFLLQRASVSATPRVYVEVTRVTVTEAGPICFHDPFYDELGAEYRAVHVPPLPGD